MSEYIPAILHYIQLQSTPDGTCSATFALPTFRNDVYAHGASIEDCLTAVEAALESYVLWALKTGEPLPEVDGVLPPILEPAHASLLMDTHTAKGNWICQSGSYIAVAEWKGAGWELRIKTGHDTVSSTTINAPRPLISRSLYNA